MKLETYRSVKDVRRLFFPSRCERWVKDTFRTGAYGSVLRDRAGWLISDTAVAQFQSRHAVGVTSALSRAFQTDNLVQFQK